MREGEREDDTETMECGEGRQERKDVGERVGGREIGKEREKEGEI